MATSSDSAPANDAIAGVAVTYALGPRLWFEKWWLVVHDLEELRAAYAGGSWRADTSGYRALVTRFCCECWDVKDWIEHDNSLPVAARSAAHLWANAQPALTLIGDVANTHKHSQRTRGFEAVVTDVQVGSGFRASVARVDRSANRAFDRRDALDLACDAVDEWRLFLQQHGVVSPY